MARVYILHASKNATLGGENYISVWGGNHPEVVKEAAQAAVKTINKSSVDDLSYPIRIEILADKARNSFRFEITDVYNNSIGKGNVSSETFFNR